MSAESFYYLLFPWLARWKQPGRISPILKRLGFIWMLGLIPGTLYIIFNPYGIPHPDRFSTGPWLQALKYTPLPHLMSFVFGVLLAELYVSTAGIGYYTTLFTQSFNPTKLLGLISILAAMAILLNEIVRRAELYYSRWRSN